MELVRDVVAPVAQNLGLGGRGAHLVIPSLIGPILATILVFNRVYWRISLVHTLALDDLCITLSLVFLYLLCIVNIVAVDHGYGRPAKSLSPSDLHIALQMFYLDQIFYKLTINLTKLSILCLYLRIFSQPWFRRTCWASVVVILGYALASIVATVFQCSPIQRVWDKARYPTGTCINITAFWYANAIYNVVTDIVILASVPGVVWKLRLPQRQRLGLTAVFGLGIFVFATSVLRMTTLDHSSKAPDTTAGTLISTMWTTIEASTAIVCACLPMLRTPVQRLVPRLFPSHAASGTGPKLPAVNGKSGVHAAGQNVPKKGLPLGSEDETATRATPNRITTRRNDRDGDGDANGNGNGDLEMGGLGHGVAQPQSWPKRLGSSLAGSDHHALGSASCPPPPKLGHRRLLSESSGCPSPTKLEDW